MHETHKARQFSPADPTYIEQLPARLRYPVFFTIPWERHGWVRCQIGTATSIPPHDYTQVWLDVPQAIFDNLTSVEVQDEMIELELGQAN